jgi:hypothetical protein
MRRDRASRMAAVVLVAAGFVAGVTFVASCGGGGGAHAAVGSLQAVHHVRHPAVPIMATAPGATGSPVTLDSTTFTPASANDVVLGYRVHGVADVSGGTVLISLVRQLTGSGFSGGLGGVGLPVGAGQEFSFTVPEAPSTFSGGPTPSTFDLRVTAAVTAFPPTADGVVNVTDLTIEVVTLEGTSVSDPSPRL